MYGEKDTTLQDHGEFRILNLVWEDLLLILITAAYMTRGPEANLLRCFLLYCKTGLILYVKEPGTRCDIYLVQFSLSVMSDSLRPHESQHARAPCPSPTPGVHSNSCPSSRWCHPAISSSVVPFSSCPQSLPASETFPMSQLFTWGGQSIGVSASASVLPMNTQDWSPLGWTGWTFLQYKESQESSLTPQFKSISSSVLNFLHSPTLTSIHDHWKNHSLD